MHERVEEWRLPAGDVAASWQNAANPMDVNNDEVVSPLDALAFAAPWGKTGPGPDNVTWPLFSRQGTLLGRFRRNLFAVAGVHECSLV